MTILLTFDEGYAPHAAVVIESILEHCKIQLKFVIIYYNLSLETRNLLYNHYQDRVQAITFIQIEETAFTMFDEIKSCEHISNPKNVLLRLFLDRVPEDEYILYIDCDTIICDNIMNILDFSDDNMVLSAVTEYDALYKTKNISNINNLVFPISIDPIVYESYYNRAYKALEMDYNTKYFCAGVMLINMNKWKSQNIGINCLNYISNYPQKCYAADQDALNHFINGNYKELPPRWNSGIGYPLFTMYKDIEYIESYKNPAIIHTAGRIKPWHYKSGKYIRTLYAKYRKRTPWPQIKYTDKSLLWDLKVYTKSIIKKFIPYKIVCAIRRYFIDTTFYASARR